ncbi:MAG: four-carbon acid sugar kinase family protein [Sphaerochaetaceae bacterium]|nr:four-carbon acid sugar kinase family protein [Sphaerochaetaceae bacterium]
MNKLGVIADDFTGATDIAGFLAANGVVTVQTNGVSSIKLEDTVQAIVVSLKSRSCPKQEAIDESLKALMWLKEQGCTQFYFKYCSTFDSTAKGNIGPVTDALMEALGSTITIICPALPINGRTVYKGYLFVQDVLLNESGMRHHPVTPMHDAKLLRLMEAQSAHKACEIHVEAVEKGSNHLKRCIEEARDSGFSYVVVDALKQNHLDIIARATKDLVLLTGGSGVAESLAKLTKKSSQEKEKAIEKGKPKLSKSIILAGSCSQATNLQVDAYKAIAPSVSFDIGAYDQNNYEYVADITAWVAENINHSYAPLVYATKSAERVKELGLQYPHIDIGQEVERFFAQLSIALYDIGIRNYIIAGGETSGVVAKRLGIEGFLIGPQIDPGVPWVRAVNKEIHLALKSGNFGSVDFFKKAQDCLHA